MTLLAEHWRRKGSLAFDRLHRASENAPTMRQGEGNRDAVILLQQALIMTGCPIRSGATGNYRDETAAAVRALQADPRFNLGRDVGVSGKQVLEALDRSLRSPGATPEAPPPAEYEFVIEGRRYRTESTDLAGQFRHLIAVVQNLLIAARGSRQRFIDRQNSFVRAISDAVGVAHGMPPDRIFVDGLDDLNRAGVHLLQDDYPAAEARIKRAILRYDLAKGLWRDYIRGTYTGADTMRDTLGSTSAALLGVSLTYLSAGAAVPGALLASAARGAAIGGGTSLVRQVSVQAHERFIDLDPEVNWRALVNSAAVAGASAFVSSAIGGWLRPHMVRIFPRLMTEFVVSSQAELNAWNQAFVRFSIAPLTREAVRRMTWTHVGARVLTSIPTSALTTAYNAIASHAREESLDDFIYRYWKTVPRDAVVRAIGQALVGAAPP